MNTTTYGVDIAKSVFQLHWVEPETGEICRRKLPRAKVTEFFAKRGAARVAMEACGGAHHWARTLTQLGHQVELLPPKQVRPFVSGSKDDASDARAILLAAQHTDIRRVAIKSCEQQALLSLHRMRSHWVSVRTASVNALRGLLYEFGVVLPKGRKVALRDLAERRAAAQEKLPAVMLRLLERQCEALRDIDAQIDALEGELHHADLQAGLATRLQCVPGIGPLTGSALAATLGDGSAWRSAREFAACVGLTPGHSGSGGKVRIGKITKRGDAYLRTLLIHGARNLVRAAKAEWIVELLKRRPFNVVAVAVAHKIAKVAWAMARYERTYSTCWRSQQAEAHVSR
jgi:transposase